MIDWIARLVFGLLLFSLISKFWAANMWFGAFGASFADIAKRIFFYYCCSWEGSSYCSINSEELKNFRICAGK